MIREIYEQHRSSKLIGAMKLLPDTSQVSRLEAQVLSICQEFTVKERF
jgi:hypothetical protein